MSVRVREKKTNKFSLRPIPLEAWAIRPYVSSVPAAAEIRQIWQQARQHGLQGRPVWPMIVLRTPKGWTCPPTIDGKKCEGYWRSHQVPMSDMDKPGHVKILERWMKSYRPAELFDKNGRLKPELAALAPTDRIHGQPCDGRCSGGRPSRRSRRRKVPWRHTSSTRKPCRRSGTSRSLRRCTISGASWISRLVGSTCPASLVWRCLTRLCIRRCRQRLTRTACRPNCARHKAFASTDFTASAMGSQPGRQHVFSAGPSSPSGSSVVILAMAAP